MAAPDDLMVWAQGRLAIISAGSRIGPSSWMVCFAASLAKVIPEPPEPLVSLAPGPGCRTQGAGRSPRSKAHIFVLCDSFETG